MKTKSYIADYDHLIFFAYIILVFIGLYMQLNISSVRTDMSFFYRQSIWFVISLASVWFAFKVVNLKKIRKYIIIFVFLTIALLVLVLLFGTDVKGGTRSLRIWKISIQPSLIARVVLVLYFAHILDRKKDFLKNSHPIGFIRNFHPLIVFSIIIFGLILYEKHFSPLVISGFTLLSLLWLAKIRFSTISLILAIILICGFLVIKFGPEYRNERMEIYAKYSLFHKIFNKQSDYQGEKNYQVKESLISLSSGKLFGTSSGRGTGKHYFLPEAKTDYIFAIIGEEFGFIGAFSVLGLYIFLFYRSLKSSNKKENLFLRLAGYGLGMNIFFNAMVNIGVGMSALPSTGVTLPFISYGGTSLLVNSFSIGLLLNISAKRTNF